MAVDKDGMLARFQSALSKGSCSDMLLDWKLTPAQIDAAAEELAAYVEVEYNKIAAAVSTPSWDAICAAKNSCDMLTHVASQNLTFLQHVSDSKEVRDAATKADERLSTVFQETASRHDVYLAFQAYSELNEPLTGEHKRFFERVMREFKRRGLHLEEATRVKVLDMNKRISTLGIQFAKNLGEENTKLYFTTDELKGMPEDFIAGLKQRDEDGKYELELSYPHAYPVLKLCDVSNTRYQMEKAFNARCIDTNPQILEELVTLRHEKAQLLGYPTHAAFVTEERMAKTPQRVMDFLVDLSAKLDNLQDDEIATMLALKKIDEGDSFNGKLHAWDSLYYRNKVEKVHYNVDHEAIKAYFPLERVTEGLINIYQELLGLKITHVADAPRWHDEAIMYTVEDSHEGTLLGYMYLDLHPREGKYKHAACFALQPSCALKQGRIVPVAALVCNFPKSLPDRPSLLRHSDVETFFHEFGHGIHRLCSLAEMHMFEGTRVERDFVELPSQMLENWAWERDSLVRMSGRLEDQKPLPDDLIETLIKSRSANAGVINKRQLLFSLFDQKIHTQAKVDTASLYQAMCKEICKLEVTEETNFVASFGHLAGGYDAQYYGYLWSEVYAMDVFETVFKGHLFNEEKGRLYRSKVLACGGSKDGMDMLVDLLGREPEPTAFLRSKGVNV